MPSSNDLYEAKVALWDSRNGEGMEATVKFATMKIEAIKDELCGCSVESFHTLQGEVRAYQELLDAITTEPYRFE